MQGRQRTDRCWREIQRRALLSRGRRCRKGVRHTHAVDAGTWEDPGWKALGFTAAEAHLNYAYSFISRGSGATAHFTARAVGDLTCDGVMATFERLGRLDRAGTVTVSAGVYGLNEFE